MSLSGTMRLRVTFFVVTLSLVIGAVCAGSGTEEDSSKDNTYENEINFPAEGSSSNEGSYGNEGSSSREGSFSVWNDARRLSTPEECARTCKNDEEPKTCYYHFTVENYATLTSACDLCRRNTTSSLSANCQCITADGYELSGIKVANRMYPGPSIMVCLNDYVVIDVENHVHGDGITIHWHGIFQNGYQYYDGVPYLTQCPIDEGTTFRYQWRASNSGTHFWHSHNGLQMGDGLGGAIVVREPKINEPNNDLWDDDEIENVIFLSDLFHDSPSAHYPGNRVRKTHQLPDNYLINGMGQWTDPDTGKITTTPLATFTVKHGRRYRFRMINSCTLTCPVQMTIQGHNLTVIASDGQPLAPVIVDSITSFSAERYDFVLNAVQSPGSYWIQLRGLAACVPLKTQQLAILRYESATIKEPLLERPSYETGLEAGIVLNQMNARCDGSPNARNVVCVSQLENAKPVSKRILTRHPDIRLFMPFGYHLYQPNDLFKPGTYQGFVVPLGTAAVVPRIGKNIINVLPPSVLISQRDEIPVDQFCSLEELPSRCNDGGLCRCSLLEEFPLNSVVEIILVDEGNVTTLSHPFHLHGANFYVVGEGFPEDYNVTTFNLASIKQLDEKGLIRRRLIKPPAKDTYAIPNTGFTIIRFLADNPGYWFFHCHFLFHMAPSIGAVFHVGVPSDLPLIPEGFPRCGNFVPPISNDS